MPAEQAERAGRVPEREDEMNEILSTVFGNIATEPRHSITPQGVPLTSFRMASTTSRFDQELQGYVDGHTTWLNVSCWRGLAFNAAASLHKGQPVIVYGTLHVRDWKDGDRSGREVELHAVSVGHDLRRGRTEFARVTRPVADRVLLGGDPPPAASSAGGAGGAERPDGVAVHGVDATEGTAGHAAAVSAGNRADNRADNRAGNRADNRADKGADKGAENGADKGADKGAENGAGNRAGSRAENRADNSADKPARDKGAAA
jgi:single-strand DNA-binding protein